MTSKLYPPYLLTFLFIFCAAPLAHAKTLMLNSSFSVGDLGIYQGTGITYDSTDDKLWLSDSGGQDRLVEIPLTGGSISTELPHAAYGIRNVEGMTYHPGYDVLVMMEMEQDKLYGMYKNGNLTDTNGIDLLGGGITGPAGITLDTSDNTRYLVDYAARRVFHLAGDNSIIASYSTGNNGLEGIAYDSTNDKLLTIDRTKDIMWTSNTDLTSGVSTNLADLDIEAPSGVAWRASDGHRFICDFTDTPKMFELDSSNNRVNDFQLNTSNYKPADVAYHSTTQRLYVINNATIDSIFVYKTDGTFVEEYVLGRGESEGIGVIENGNLYVLDYDSSFIELKTDWTFVRQEEIQQPYPTGGAGLSFDGTYYYIADYAKKKVFRVEQNGTTQGYFDTSGFGCDQPEGIYYDSAGGNLFIVDSDSDRLYEVNTSGILQASYDLSAHGIGYPTGITMKNGEDNIYIADIEDDRVYYMSLIAGGGAMGVGPLGGGGSAALSMSGGYRQGFDGGTLYGYNTRGAGPVEIVDYEGNNVVEITEGVTPGDILPPEGVPPEDYTPDRSVRMYRMIDVPSLAPELSFDFMLGEFYDPNYFAVFYQGDELVRLDINDKTDHFTTVTIDMSPYAGARGTLTFFMAGSCSDAIRDRVYIDDISLTGIPESPSILLLLSGSVVFLTITAVRGKRRLRVQ